MSAPSLPPGLAGLLGYLDDLGWNEVYLRPGAAVGAADSSAGPGSSPAGPTKAAAVAAPEKIMAAAAAAPEGTAAAVALATLAAEAAVCTRCALSQGRHSVVFGDGNPAAELMLVGEGPGSEEDRRGLPFVGPAGELLARILQAIELTREQVYIANVVKCRPPGNRDPLPEEVAACRGYLERQIDLVRPKILVALGKVAAQTLLGHEAPVGRMRGQWHSVRGIPTLVTYHPAALLRNPALKRPTWEDMQQVRDRLRSGPSPSD